MEPLGISLDSLLVAAIIPTVLIGLPIISLIDLGKKKLTGTTLAIWVLVICAIPFLGPLAYWIVKPTTENNA